MNEMAILSNIKVPVAIFHGRDDQIVNPVYFEKLNFDNLWRNKILMIANAGHCVQMENAKVFNHSLSEFCEFIFSDRPLLSL
jgi:pimeloyl-ACP methyl ester carboxylesterase